jgi:hypothetical protein
MSKKDVKEAAAAVGGVGKAASPSSKTATGIDAIEARQLPTEKAWVSFIKSLNPLGPAAQAYAETLHYRVECKRIEAEAERVRQQAKAVKQAMRHEFELNMEHLQQRRLALDRFFDTVQGELGQHHVERMTMMKVAEQATAHMLSDKCGTAEDRAVMQGLIREITSQLPLMGDRANDSLKTLLSALPVVPLPGRMLPNAGATD